MTNQNKKPFLALTSVNLAACMAFTMGCATSEYRDPRDPWEPMNRGIDSFNNTLDRAIVKPIARGYQAVTPDPVDRAITNFFNNIGDVTVAANNLLQFKVLTAFEDVGRIMVNTTFGLLGFIDIATDMGIQANDEDFGQTLGYWGIGPGPYLVIPLLGPSTVRDAVGTAVDTTVLDPIFWIDDNTVRNSLAALRFVDTRANLLRAERIVDEAALDRYTFIRDAYLQRRRYLVYDGNPPPEDLPDEYLLDEEVPDEALPGEGVRDEQVPDAEIR